MRYLPAGQGYPSCGATPDDLEQDRGWWGSWVVAAIGLLLLALILIVFAVAVIVHHNLSIPD
jgi:hypothetical protein